MKSNTKTPFIPYTPTSEDLAVGCDDFVEIHKRENGGITEIDFGRKLADSILIDTAINEGLSDVPDLSDEGELWSIYRQRVKLGAQAVSKCVECPLYASCSGASTLRLEAGIVTPEQQLRREILNELAKDITTEIDGVVLKGGFAMILYGINRSTDDVDFDIYKPLTDTEKDKLKKIYQQAGGTADEPKVDTKTTFRYKIEKSVENENGQKPRKSPLTIEIKTVEKPSEDSDDITIINGIRVYKPNALLRQKLGTYLERVKGRDSVDVSYLLSHFPETIEAIDTELLEEVLSRMESNPRKEGDTIGLGDLESEAIKLTLPAWLRDDKVLIRMLTESRDKIKDELDRRNINK